MNQKQKNQYTVTTQTIQLMPTDSDFDKYKSYTANVTKESQVDRRKTIPGDSFTVNKSIINSSLNLATDVCAIHANTHKYHR